MRYRDDREALRDRADGLADELAAAERRLREAEARVREHEAKDEREQKELEALRREVARLRPKPTTNHGAKPALAIGAMVAMTGLAGVLLFLQGSSEVVESEAVAPGPVPAAAAPAAAEASARSGHAVFGAFVTGSERGAVPVATPCLVHAALRDTPGGVGLAQLTIRCADVEVYDSSRPMGGGMQNLTGGAVELTAKSGENHYVIEFGLTGQWQSDKPQIRLANEGQRGRIWSDGVEKYELTFYLDDLGFPRTGPGLSSNVEPLQDRPFRRRPLVVTERRGAVPAALAATDPECELRLRPAPLRSQAGGITCRAVVRCGSEIIYGSTTTGFAGCTAGETPSAIDSVPSSGDNDPAFELGPDFVTLSDGEGDSAWSATLRIEHAPCLGEGTWRAWSWGESARTGTLVVAKESAELRWEGAAPIALEAPSCHEDRVALVAREGGKAFVLALGPKFATAGGHGPDGDTIAFLRQ